MERPVAAQLAYTARTSTVMVSQASGAVQPSRIEPAISSIATLTRSGTAIPSASGMSIFSFWYFLVTAVPCLKWCLGGRPTPTSRPVRAGDCHLNFYETRDNLRVLQMAGMFARRRVISAA